MSLNPRLQRDKPTSLTAFILRPKNTHTTHSHISINPTMLEFRGSRFAGVVLLLSVSTLSCLVLARAADSGSCVPLSGSPPSCSGFTNTDNCNKNTNCAWHTTAAQCSGSALPCSSVGYTNCRLQMGCAVVPGAFGTTFCAGSTISCVGRLESQCALAGGCKWTKETGSCLPLCSSVTSKSNCDARSAQCKWVASTPTPPPPIECGITQPTNGILVGTCANGRMAAGSVCNIQCNDGYVKVGSLPVCPPSTATSEGQACVLSSCPVPQPSVGLLSSDCAKGSLPGGKTCTLTCPTSYTQSGAPFTCLQDSKTLMFTLGGGQRCVAPPSCSVTLPSFASKWASGNPCSSARAGQAVNLPIGSSCFIECPSIGIGPTSSGYVLGGSTMLSCAAKGDGTAQVVGNPVCRSTTTAGPGMMTTRPAYNFP